MLVSVSRPQFQRASKKRPRVLLRVSWNAISQKACWELIYPLGLQGKDASFPGTVGALWEAEHPKERGNFSRKKLKLGWLY